MTRDKANIFKLDKEILETYKDNEFDDCMPGAKNFAECLKKTILTKPTPYVLLLEDNFGMGKTHFSTRFTYYLRNCNIDTIYFSAWENDYIEQPFVSFSKEIIKYFKQYESLWDKFGNTSKAIFSLISNIIKTTTEIGKAIEAVECFINNFIEHDDYLLSFKKSLKDFIESLPNKKLVIIVDELDRCRPDYAMKTLEIIKHFFDIEGLFIIVPTNEHSLQKCVKALYGIDEEDKQSLENEHYFNKFFTDKLNLYKPNYLNLVQTIITESSIQKLLDNGKMSLSDRYNSLTTVQDKLAEFGNGFKLTMREMVNICEKAIYFCHHINRKIDCEYLAYLLCQNVSRNNNSTYVIQSEHPLSDTSKKKELLTFSIPKEVYTIGHINYEQQFMQEHPFLNNRNFNSYKEFDEFYEYYSKNLKSFDVYRKLEDRFMRITYGYNFEPFEQYIENKKREIDIYKSIWDSDDNDNELKQYYNHIVNNEPSIHADKLKLTEVEI